ncbi:hypothetical protein WH87_15425 [Devosia epidermidihirudinis]|uniref:Acetamidase n=1 Tax=Devosia epidermidihirudinis TaxID=1293439 RepID=A0A0F5Q5M6_9HYPH|nr:acetamidase/formamidase family protein [Devosia epidermidihirudinis]KKC35946.1 hypothetical protein WH87_15425 [Devosia epidermidihirudinis]
MNGIDDFVFHLGGHEPNRTVERGQPFTVFTEDCFGGVLDSVDGKPRELAPFPRVNPLTGPFAIDGVRAGDVVAVHLKSLVPARDWGVATISPNFGVLSGTRLAPNLQPEQDEHVWIWRFTEDGQFLTTPTTDGRGELKTSYRPFHGTLGVAPANGEVRLCVVPGDFGGNLDLPDLGPGATLYLRANVDGAHLYIGDGHFAQGDGEISGTAIEGAFNTTLVVDRCAADAAFDWPRLETDSHIGVIGATRPVDDAARIALNGLIRWVVEATGLALADAHQLVSQSCTLRIGNLVNPSFTVIAMLPKSALGDVTVMDGLHAKLSKA